MLPTYIGLRVCAYTPPVTRSFAYTRRSLPPRTMYCSPMVLARTASPVAAITNPRAAATSNVIEQRRTRQQRQRQAQREKQVAEAKQEIADVCQHHGVT